MAANAKFAADPRRRALIGKIKVAVKELGYDDDTYRGALHLVTGHMSAANCSDGELTRMVEHLRTKGFRPKPKKAGVRPAADHAPARKARALWISLYHLGAIDNPKEQALEAFACRQLKVEAFQWADQGRCYKLIEALKAMAERHGWVQGDMLPTLAAPGRLRLLKRRLCDAILVKLKENGAAGADWNVERAAFSLCGIDHGLHVIEWSVEQLDECARSLGQKLRGAKSC